MKLSKHKRETLASMDMTPMIDIVFLLLIFFMTISQVSKINREEMALSQQQGEKDQETGTLIVNITMDNEVIVSGKKRTVQELVVVVGRELQHVGNNPRRLKVVIRQDKRANCRVLNEVLKMLDTLGIHKNSYSVEVP